MRYFTSVLLCCLLLFCACDQTSVPSAPDTGTSSQSTADIAPADIDQDLLDAEFTSYDRKTDYKPDGRAVFADGGADLTGQGFTFQDGILRITAGGHYELMGTLENGSVIIDVPADEKVQLVLKGVSITSASDAPLVVLCADKVKLTLADGTQNTFTDALTRTDDTHNACIWSADDLTVNGSGSLTVNGNYNNGIDTKNDLRIVSGSVTVTAVNNAIKANDSMAMLDGTLIAVSSDDGIKTSTADRPDKGYIRIFGGTVTVDSADDALQAATDVQIAGGTVRLNAGGKQFNCPGTVAVADGCLQN